MLQMVFRERTRMGQAADVAKVLRRTKHKKLLAHVL